MKRLLFSVLAVLAMPALAEAQVRLPAPLAMQPPPGAASDAAILNALNNIEAQVGALRQAVAQQEQDIKAMQVVLNLVSNNALKAQANSSNALSTLPELESETAALQTRLGQMQTSVNQLATVTNELATTTHRTDQNVSLIVDKQVDMARRLYITCVLTGIASAAGSAGYPKEACTANWWDPNSYQFDLPFGTPSSSSGHHLAQPEH